MAAPAVDFNPTRQGKFKVLVGDSLKPNAEDGSQSSNVYSSFRYNTTPPEGLSKLNRSDNGQYSLSYNDDKDTTYAGAQRPGRKLECILVYNPKDNTFTLERMSSVFTFNQSHPTSDSDPIPTATYDEEATAGGGSGNGNGTDDEEAPLADAENPFDVRHFNGRVLPNSDEDDEDKDDQEHKDEDTDVDMDDADAHGVTMDHDHDHQEPASTPGAVPSSSTPVPVSSATPTPNPTVAPMKRKPKKPQKPVDPFMKKPSAKVKAQQAAAAAAAAAAAKSPLLHPGAANDRFKEASMSPQPRLPSPINPPAKSRAVQEESSESDVDSSDEDDDRDRGGRRGQPPVNRHIQSVDPKSEGKADAEEDDEFNLEEAMEEFDFMNDDEDESGGGGGGGGGGGDLTIEGEDERGTGIGLGISNGRNMNSVSGAPMSLSEMTGSRRLDDSEEESSEEE
ncbi:hypothetical protein TWF696_007035 [Orbilia brochopaga]|uniref:Transcription elongation factor Eaf N-terminal domain-containing protein n=1 Tax=Orbilia brochopaga TaxID=3140254 RepID=A0AAV9UUX7_9PEZI